MRSNDGLTTQKGWNDRYLSSSGLEAPGTFTHSDKGNRYFYLSKFRALDRCLKAMSIHLYGKTILDAAGGSGQFINYFLKRGVDHILVTDFAQTALDIVDQRYKEEPRVSTQLFDLKSENYYWTDSYDFTFVMEAIFLLATDDDLARSIENLASALKADGYLIISDVFPRRTIQQNAYVVRRSKAHFEHLLSRNGLFVVTYVPQTFVFNRRLFGRFQHILEKVAGRSLYWLDQLAINLGIGPPVDSPADVKYLIAKKSRKSLT